MTEEFTEIPLVEKMKLLRQRCEAMIDGSIQQDELLATCFGDHYATACYRIAELRAQGLDASPMFYARNNGNAFDFSIRVRVGTSIEQAAR